MDIPPAQPPTAPNPSPVPEPKRSFGSKMLIILIVFVLLIIGVAAGYIALRPDTEEENISIEEDASTETGTSTEEGTTTLPILGTSSEEGTTTTSVLDTSDIAGTSSGTSSVGTTKEQEEYLLELREDVEKEESFGSEPIPENKKVTRPRD